VDVISLALRVTQQLLDIVPVCAIYATHATDGYQQIPLKQAGWPKYEVESSSYLFDDCRSSQYAAFERDYASPPPFRHSFPLLQV
jgi:hypothetical protein